MSPGLEGFHRSVIDGSRDGAVTFTLRCALRLCEPLYSVAVSSRNTLYHRGVFATHRAARPVISIGNITTGGTGKTPIVQWLTNRLHDAGHHPAILLRGYKGGDEQRLLQSNLPGVIVQANPSRIAGAKAVLAAHPNVQVFVLDDGFQHRRLHRDFDLVLIDASNPFGFDHVLPRGLLREPLGGLARASAFLITHTDLSDGLSDIEKTLKRHNPTAPIFRCSHVHHDLLRADNSAVELTELHGAKVMTFCGIGNPAAFERQIAHVATVAGSHRFDDHHHYTQVDLLDLAGHAKSAGAKMLITTEKDWVKVQSLVGGIDHPPILRARLAIRFESGHEAGLLNGILAAFQPQANAKAPSHRVARADEKLA